MTDDGSEEDADPRLKSTGAGGETEGTRAGGLSAEPPENEAEAGNKRRPAAAALAGAGARRCTAGTLSIEVALGAPAPLPPLREPPEAEEEEEESQISGLCAGLRERSLQLPCDPRPPESAPPGTPLPREDSERGALSYCSARFTAPTAEGGGAAEAEAGAP